MKKIAVLFVFIIGSLNSRAQQNMISVEGGWAMADLEEVSTSMNGWRIAGLYEFNPYAGKVTHGISFGYVGMSTDVMVGATNIHYELGSFPVYYAPGLLLGKDKFKFQLKGALGWQFSNINRTGLLIETKNSDGGITLGAGAGGLYNINSNTFLNFGYEFLFMDNSFYLDEFLHTIKLGLGFKF
ncbi:MAG: outer membrane beta-barrel protein [Bacteroidia bacterium]|nr:outer membrane beta-barrel protein [Bacteroidia bacterium]